MIANLIAVIAICSGGAPTRVKRAEPSVTVLREKYLSITIGPNECSATDHGAKGDGKANDTVAIQAALDACGAAGGGRVTLPAPGRYLTSAITVPAPNIEFHIPSGATLLVSDDMKAWPKNQHIIEMKNLHDVAITGGGTVDGQGLVWWRAEEKKKDVFRPHMVDANGVKNLLLTDTIYLNAPNHVLELGADYTELSGITVLSPPSTGDCKKTDACAHNTDAVDVHGEPFYIHNVNFTTGDDNVAVHANGTLVEDSYFGTGHGASIGSLCDDWITNVTFRNITFQGTTAGCRIKSHPGCSGHVWDVTYESLTMHDVGQPVDLTQFYDAPSHPKPSTMHFDSIRFSNIQVFGSSGTSSPAIDMECDKAWSQEGNCHVVIDNVAFHDDSGKSGMKCTGVNGTMNGLTGISDHDCAMPPSSS